WIAMTNSMATEILPNEELNKIIAIIKQLFLYKFERFVGTKYRLQVGEPI
ncbi:8843_t:CDS:2, partial [Dentiscutata erythropus]